MTEPIRISPSKLGLGYLCPSGIIRVPDAVSSDSAASRFGRAGHSVLRWCGAQGATELPDLAPFRERYVIAEDQATDFAAACAIALRRFLDWAASLAPPAQASVEFETETPSLDIAAETRTFLLQGTADVVAWGDETLDVLDYKLGHVESTDSWAAQGLAYLACGMFGSVRDEDSDRQAEREAIREGSSSVVFFGDGSRQTWRADRDEVHHWLEEFQRDVLNYYGRFSPGAHCERCDRALLPEGHILACPHAHKEVSLFLSALGTGELPAVRPDQALADVLADRLLLARLVERQAKAFVERVRLAVQDSPNGRLILSDGRYLGFRSKPRREIRPLLGLPILLQFADADTIEDAVKVSKSAALDAIKAKMEKDDPKRSRGWKVALEREVDKALTEAKAFRETEIRELGIWQDEEPKS